MSGLPEAQAVPHRSAGRRLGLVAGIVVGVLAVLAVALWLADGLFRGIAEDGVESAIEAKLPDTVEAEIDVTIAGGPFLPQAAAGEFSEVTLTADDAVISGIPVDIAVTAHDVPLNESGTIDEATATVTGGEDAANALLVLGGADPQLSLGDGTLSYGQSTSFLGMTIGYTIVAKPEAHGDTVTLLPVDADITTDHGNVDLTALVNRLIGSEPIRVCVASALPEGVSVDGVDVTPDELRLTLSATDIPRNGPDFGSRGSCAAG